MNKPPVELTVKDRDGEPVKPVVVEMDNSRFEDFRLYGPEGVYRVQLGRANGGEVTQAWERVGDAEHFSGKTISVRIVDHGDDEWHDVEVIDGD